MQTWRLLPRREDQTIAARVRAAVRVLLPWLPATMAAEEAVAGAALAQEAPMSLVLGHLLVQLAHQNQPLLLAREPPAVGPQLRRRPAVYAISVTLSVTLHLAGPGTGQVVDQWTATEQTLKGGAFLDVVNGTDTGIARGERWREVWRTKAIICCREGFISFVAAVLLLHLCGC